MMDPIYDKFSHYYDSIYSFYDYSNECDQIENLLVEHAGSKPSTVLDLACGTGTHAIEMTKRGYTVTGIDASPIMIGIAEEKALRSSAVIDLRTMDMRRLFLERPYDSAVCLFGGFGYLLLEEDRSDFLNRLRGTLAVDAPFLFEFWNVGGIKTEARNYTVSDGMVTGGYTNWLKVEGEKGETIVRLARSTFDPREKVMSIDMDFHVFKGKEVLDDFSEQHRIRAFGPPEIKRILEKEDFMLTALYEMDLGSQDLHALDLKSSSRSFRLMAVAKSS